jgi:bifunctional NMN adenylyltransferase/nudix hydrolase
MYDVRSSQIELGIPIMLIETYDYVVFMGRFQPFHNAHYKTIKKALELGKEVIILIGSANAYRTVKNPWTWQERQEMISGCFGPHETERMHFVGIEDRLYNLNLWLHFVQREVHKIAGESKKIALIGHHKDNSSFYLDSFPQWKQIEFPNVAELNATDIRNEYFNPLVTEAPSIFDCCPDFVTNYLINWYLTDEYQNMVEEFQFLVDHNKKWENAPYTPTFNASDAVVFCSGHILLIRRRATAGS